MLKPHIICLMATSVDGRVKIRRWSRFDVDALVHKPYERIHEELKGDAWICGRITMQGYAMGEPPPPYDGPKIPREDHFAKPDAGSFAVGLDPKGRMNWGDRNDITGDHVVVVLTEAVGDGHLDTLRRAGVSYIFAGRNTIDLPLVVDKLAGKLGVKRLLVEGGGRINGSFLEAGLVDELRLLLVPTVDGLFGSPSLFDYEGPEEKALTNLQLSLEACERLDGGVLDLTYKVTPAG